MGESGFSDGETVSRRLSDCARRSLALSRRAAELSREAANISAEIAANHERLARLCGPDSKASSRLAAAYRHSENCQRAAAKLYENYMRHLARWLTRQDPQRELRPVFMSTVASVAGWQGAVLTLLTLNGDEGLVAASGPAVRTAHELEVSMAEGPSREAMRDHTLAVACGPQMEERWPQYGPAVRELGVGSVASTPVHLGFGCGEASLTMIDPCPSTSVHKVRHLGHVADALAAVLQVADGSPVASGDPLGLRVFEQEDFQPSLHAAAGVLHQRCGYDIADAVALIRAHAFVENRSVAAVADGVLRGDWLP